MLDWGSIFWFLIIGGLVYYMMRGGGCCGGHNHGSHENHDKGGREDHGGQPAHLEHHHEETPQNINNNLAKDPVCGMGLKTGSPLSSEHLGHTFHFCSEQCKKLFDLNPGKYVHSSL